MARVATREGVACIMCRVTAPPCEAHRATSKDVRATVHSSKSNMGLRKTDVRARTTSVSVSCACRQSGPEAGRKKVFSGSYGGLSTGVWTGRFTGFSTTSSTLTLWISEHSKPQPAWCALPLLLYSTQHLHLLIHWPQQLRTYPFLNEDIIIDGLCQELPAYLACAEGVSFKAESMEDLAAKKVESGRNRKRIDNLPIGKVQSRWFFSSISSLLLRLLSEFSLLRAALSGQQELHSRLCGDHRDASQHAIIAETITLMCSS